jgi:Uri superfamily endonuclease
VVGQPGLAPYPARLDPDDVLASLPSTGGTYGLALELKRETQVQVGALGTTAFPKSTYVYVGSAWGPGGLRARVGRHVRGGGALRWHIDYLRAAATPIAVWFAPGERLECAWAQVLMASPTAEIIVPRFGASDCHCASHLFRIADGELASLAFPCSPQRLAVDAPTSISLL